MECSAFNAPRSNLSGILQSTGRAERKDIKFYVSLKSFSFIPKV